MGKKGNWKLWAVIVVIFAMIVAATIRIDGQPVLNITGTGTKELIVVDAGHGGMQVRPKKYGLGMGGCPAKVLVA